MKSFLRAAGLDFSAENYFQNKKVPDSGIGNLPDHRFENEKIIVEFDGIQHYQKIDEIKKDRMKDKVYGQLGYKIIRIPFFVQPSSETLKHYFNVDGTLDLQYPHGFIIYDSTPPTNFCSLGLDRFIDEFKKFPEIVKNDIVKSLKKLIELGEEKEYVIPKQFERIFEQYIKNTMLLTKAICNKGFSSNSSILLRINFSLGGQESSPQSLTAYSLDRYAPF